MPSRREMLTTLAALPLCGAASRAEGAYVNQKFLDQLRAAGIETEAAEARLALYEAGVVPPAKAAEVVESPFGGVERPIERAMWSLVESVRPIERNVVALMCGVDDIRNSLVRPFTENSVVRVSGPRRCGQTTAACRVAVRRRGPWIYFGADRDALAADVTHSRSLIRRDADCVGVHTYEDLGDNRLPLPPATRSEIDTVILDRCPPLTAAQLLRLAELGWRRDGEMLINPLVVIVTG